MDQDLFNELPFRERLLLVKEHAEWLATNECFMGEHAHAFYMLYGLVIEVVYDFVDMEVKDVEALRYTDEGMKRLLWNMGIWDLREFTQQGDAPF